MLYFTSNFNLLSPGNDGKTEETDVGVPAVAEQRAREDQSGPPRPEGYRGGQEGGRDVALHGR